MSLKRGLKIAFAGLCVFVASFALTAAVYSYMVSDHLVERGTEPGVGVGLFACMVAIPLGAVAAYLVNRSTKISN